MRLYANIKDGKVDEVQQNLLDPAFAFLLTEYDPLTGTNALHMAAYTHQSDVLALLLQFPAIHALAGDADPFDMTPVMIAGNAGNCRMLELLLRLPEAQATLGRESWISSVEDASKTQEANAGPGRRNRRDRLGQPRQPNEFTSNGCALTLAIKSERLSAARILLQTDYYRHRLEHDHELAIDVLAYVSDTHIELLPMLLNFKAIWHVLHKPDTAAFGLPYSRMYSLLRTKEPTQSKRKRLARNATKGRISDAELPLFLCLVAESKEALVQALLEHGDAKQLLAIHDQAGRSAISIAEKKYDQAMLTLLHKYWNKIATA